MIEYGCDYETCVFISFKGWLGDMAKISSYIFYHDSLSLILLFWQVVCSRAKLISLFKKREHFKVTKYKIKNI